MRSLDLHLLRTLGIGLAILAVSVCRLPGQETPKSTTKKIRAVESTQHSTEKPGWYMGRQIARTMSYHGADWLLRNSRDGEEQPQKLLETLQLKPGQNVCDFGCGNGYYTLRLAQRVGPRGNVVAVDIQQEMLDLLVARSQTRGLNNIQPILATTKDPQLPPEKLDWVLMVDVYHELSHPGETLRAVREKLKPLGRIALVEFRTEDPDVPIKRLHKMSQAQAFKELTANGLKLVGQTAALPWQHVLLFARDDSPLPSVQLALWKATEPTTPPLEPGIGEIPSSPLKSP